MLRRIALGLAAAALALGLVACGGVASTLDPVAAAAERSADAGSVRVRIDASFSSAGVGGSIEAEGVFDEDEGEMTVDASNLVENLNAPSGLGGLGAFDGRLKLILAKEDGRQVVYLGMPALASLIPGGKSWIRADVEEAAKQTGGEFGKLLDLTNQSPAETLDLIGGAGAVVKVGAETIDGDDVTHYRATVDLVQALEQRGIPAAAVQDLVAKGISTELPVDVWVGVDDGYVHRVKVAYDGSIGADDVSAEFTITMSDWGSDVSIDVPSDDEAFDVTALASQLSKS